MPVTTYDPIRLTAGKLYSKLLVNARKRSIEVTLTVADVDGLMRQQGMQCAVTGIRFCEITKAEGARVRPYMPSVDRKDARIGYTPENVRIVCAAVNAALGDWGDEVFEQIVKGAAGKRGFGAVPAKRAHPKGVIARKSPGGVRYESLVGWKGMRYYLGSFSTAADAAESYRSAKLALRAGADPKSVMQPNSRQAGTRRGRSPLPYTSPESPYAPIPPSSQS